MLFGYLLLVWTSLRRMRLWPIFPAGILLALMVSYFFSWGIALFEYLLQVPANRIGFEVYNAAELKTMQEVITFVVFSIFSVFYLGQAITVNHAIGFALICAGAFFVFRG